jgi:DNA-binding transcriptional MerR regulator
LVFAAEPAELSADVVAGAKEDLAWIEVLQCLRASGMPIRDIRRYAELVRAGDGNEGERLALLEEHRAAVRAQLAQVRRHRVHRPQGHDL